MMEKKAKNEGKMHLKGGQKMIQNEIWNGHENREGKVLPREGNGAKMNPKLGPKEL